jgi:hypothetical protein
MKNGEQPITPCIIKGKQGFGSQPTISDKEVYGLTKREYFAGLAMQGIMTNVSYPLGIKTEIVASKSIELADELLKQLGE